MKGCKAQQTSLLDILHINHFNIKHLPAHMKEHYLLYIIISLLHSEAFLKETTFIILKVIVKGNCTFPE